MLLGIDNEKRYPRMQREGLGEAAHHEPFQSLAGMGANGDQLATHFLSVRKQRLHGSTRGYS